MRTFGTSPVSPSVEIGAEEMCSRIETRCVDVVVLRVFAHLAWLVAGQYCRATAWLALERTLWVGRDVCSLVLLA